MRKNDGSKEGGDFFSLNIKLICGGHIFNMRQGKRAFTMFAS